MPHGGLRTGERLVLFMVSSYMVGHSSAEWESRNADGQRATTIVSW
jgi:hypothetical protein